MIVPNPRRGQLSLPKIFVHAKGYSTIHKDLEGFSNFDVVIIDAEGRDSAVFRSAIMAASQGLLIIPTLPSVYDIWATEDTLKVLPRCKSVCGYSGIFAHKTGNKSQHS